MIESGVERKNIRMSLHNAPIYVNKSLFGHIISSTFQRLDSSKLVASFTSSASTISTPNSATSIPITASVLDSHNTSYAPSTVEANTQESPEGQLANTSGDFLIQK